MAAKQHYWRRLTDESLEAAYGRWKQRGDDAYHAQQTRREAHCEALCDQILAELDRRNQQLALFEERPAMWIATAA